MTKKTGKWSKLYLAECESLAGRRDNPPYLRVHHLALARAAPNGHCEIERGELAQFLGKGGIPHRRPADAISLAVEYGLLDPLSTLRCLVLPLYLVDVHDPGTAKHLPCPTHDGAARRTADCHPARRHYAHGSCEPCYRATRRTA